MSNVRALILFLIVIVLCSIDLYLRRDTSLISKAGEYCINWDQYSLSYDTIFMDRASSYYPSWEQCARRDSLGNIDSTSNIYTTADGSIINMTKLKNKEIRWCALPKSMLTEFDGSPYSFGDTITVCINSKPFMNGEWVAHDVVSDRWGRTIDFLIHPENNRKQKLGLPEDCVLLTNPKLKKNSNI